MSLLFLFSLSLFTTRDQRNNFHSKSCFVPVKVSSTEPKQERWTGGENGRGGENKLTTSSEYEPREENKWRRRRALLGLLLLFGCFGSSGCLLPLEYIDPYGIVFLRFIAYQFLPLLFVTKHGPRGRRRRRRGEESAVIAQDIERKVHVNKRALSWPRIFLCSGIFSLKCTTGRKVVLLLCAIMSLSLSPSLQPGLQSACR